MNLLKGVSIDISQEEIVVMGLNELESTLMKSIWLIPIKEKHLLR